MKKNLLALTVVGALTLGAAQAETVLYGSVRMDYGSNKNDIKTAEGKLSNIKDNMKDRTSKFGDQGSRFGIKGGESLGNGLDVIFHLEFGTDGMSNGFSGDGSLNTRLAYVGFTGDWGTAVVGRVHNTFKQTLVDDSVVDDFNGVGTPATTRAAYNILLGGWDTPYFVDNPGKANHGFFAGTDIKHANLDRVGNTIAYLSPNWSGFSFNAALIADGLDENKAKGGNKKHVDLWTINAAYEHESGFYAKLGYIQGMTNADAFRADKDRKANIWGAQVGFRNDQFAVTASYSDGKLKNNSFNQTARGLVHSGHDSRKAKGWDVGASYSFGDNYASTVRLNYGEARYTYKFNENLSENNFSVYENYEFKPKEKIWAVGFEQKLSERTRVWVEYEHNKESGNARYAYGANAKNTKATNVNHSVKNDNISIGIRHDF